MITLLATLTVLAQVLLLGLLASSRMRTLVRHDALRVAWLVALVATAGSLYMSEARHFIPCTLCWYQRIAMYPMVVLLGVAALRCDRTVRWYALPLAAIGLVVSTYHYQLERFPHQETLACASAVPCTTIWFEQFGYITLPMMAGTAFALIAALVLIGGSHGQGSTNPA